MDELKKEVDLVSWLLSLSFTFNLTFIFKSQVLVTRVLVSLTWCQAWRCM